MESFVQLQKGSTPDRVHADLNGLKDDEMGRNGFIGRQAQFYRRNDPTAFRARGPIRAGSPARSVAICPRDCRGPGRESWWS